MQTSPNAEKRKRTEKLNTVKQEQLEKLQYGFGKQMQDHLSVIKQSIAKSLNNNKFLTFLDNREAFDGIPSNKKT